MVVVIHRTAQFALLQHKCPFPVFQFAVENGRYFNLFIVRLVFYAPAQMGSHFVPHDFRIEQVATDIDTTVSDDIVFAVFLTDFIGRKVHDGKVGSTATEVGNQYVFAMIEPLLIGEGGGNRFQL